MSRLSLLFAPVLLTALFGAACSRTAPHAKAAGGTGTDVTGAAADMPVSAVPSRRVAAAFASLPDRGNLIGYPAQRVERHEHASTWHRADVSEEHALRAVVTGEMTVAAPDGQPIRLRYQRHLEHPNGNWTWIGRDEHGEEAIVTFGEKAVFGSIPRHGGKELRLATSGGRSWVVEADPDKQHHPYPRRPDYVVPPELAQSFALGQFVTASASMEAVTPAAVGTTVDVALGYTTGLASELGGDSQAVTRLQHLVDITNQAYINSRINARIRLVRTVRVNYSDATDNNDALAKLSGHSGSSSVPVDPAFNALRGARDQYGADLVSLVRRFRTPQNQGCGVAWIIGGNQTGISTAHAPWGYSLVSDDLDRGDLDETDNKTYVCRKETLAHELGHNMGQTHNSDDSDGTSGAHSYSYGYREASTIGFYTVMAYPLLDGSQKQIRYFANPNVVDAATGRVTGVANASDNARSMTQTMPIISGFRSTVVPLIARTHDFNGDGISDILWRNASDGRNSIWRSANSLTPQSVWTVASQAWRVAGIGDFNGDGVSDILWRNTSDGRNSIWLSGDSATLQGISSVASQAWRVAGIGDFNGDGASDILWRNTGDGRNSIWRSGNSAAPQAVAAVASQAWQVVGIGDFNGDGISDILWRNTNDGRNSIWRSGNSATPQAVSTVGGHAWQAVGIGDFNGDGISDVLWRNTSDGRNSIWRSANSSSLQPISTVASQNWKVVGVGNFDSDGVSDVLWRNTGDGRNSIWRSGDASTSQAVTTVVGNWAVQ